MYYSQQSAIAAVVGVFVLAISIVIGLLVAYIINGILFFRLGKKAGIYWAWVAWIPGGALFVKTRIINWKLFWLFPVLSLLAWSFSRVPHHWGLLMSAILGIIGLVQSAHLFSAFGRNPYLVLLNFIPIIGNILYLVFAFQMIGKTYQYNHSVRTWYGRKIITT